MEKVENVNESKQNNDEQRKGNHEKNEIDTVTIAEGQANVKPESEVPISEYEKKASELALLDTGKIMGVILISHTYACSCI